MNITMTSRFTCKRSRAVNPAGLKTPDALPLAPALPNEDAGGSVTTLNGWRTDDIRR
jgi:hypothetical protein